MTLAIETDRTPTPDDADWQAYEAYREHGDSAVDAAKALGITRDELVRRMMRASTWLRVSGWLDYFHDCLRAGFSLADARDMADQLAAYNMRAER